MNSEPNILGTMPVSRLVLHMSWPIMLSMLTQAVYNLVDSIFVARISRNAFLALSYAYPVQTLLIAFCVGLGVAFSATLSKRIGEKKYAEADSSLFHGFTLYLLCWLLFCSFGLFLAPAFLHSCTDTPEVAELGTQYLRVVCCFCFGICAQFPIERVLQATGHPSGFMIVQGSGAVLNLILDPIFIFTFGLGVRGAAIATVIGQISGALIGVGLLFHYRKKMPLSFRPCPYSAGMFGELGRIAVPAILMQSLVSVMSLGMNAILRLWSETAVWVLGAYFKIQSFVFMPIFSVNNALIAIISYNHGAGDDRRAEEAIRFSLRIALALSLTGAVLLWVGASPLLTYCFQPDPDALALGVPSLRYTCFSFPLASVSIILSASFQSLGYNRYSLVLSLLRFIFLLLPVALVLILLFPQYVFFSLLIAEFLAMAVAIFFYRKVRREVLL